MLGRRRGGRSGYGDGYGRGDGGDGDGECAWDVVAHAGRRVRHGGERADLAVTHGGYTAVTHGRYVAESALTAVTTTPVVPSGTARARRSALFSRRCARHGTSCGTREIVGRSRGDHGEIMGRP